MRAHKLALTAQRAFWHALLRDAIQFRDLQRSMETMEVAQRQASQVYKRCGAIQTWEFMSS